MVKTITKFKSLQVFNQTVGRSEPVKNIGKQREVYNDNLDWETQITTFLQELISFVHVFEGSGREEEMAENLSLLKAHVNVNQTVRLFGAKCSYRRSLVTSSLS